MSSLNETYLFKDIEFNKQRDILIHWYYFIEKNDYWKKLLAINFKHEDEETVYKNIERVKSVEFVNVGKFFKILQNECKKYNLSDTDLLHIILFMKLIYNKQYSIHDFPLLVKNDEVIFNPIYMQ
tara:strand:- start:80 stop:454 length:375 start_codon:yes stop_codon:yes gene_type:complete